MTHVAVIPHVLDLQSLPSPVLLQVWAAVEQQLAPPPPPRRLGGQASADLPALPSRDEAAALQTRVRYTFD